MLIRTLLTIFAIKSHTPAKETIYSFSAIMDIGCDPPHIGPDNPNVIRNITRNMWIQSKLYELESFRRSNKDKLELANIWTHVMV